MNSSHHLAAGTRRLAGWIASLLPLLFTLSAVGHEPLFTKLHARVTGNPSSNAAGRAVAISDRFLLLGEPSNDDTASGQGAAHVYDARTGRYLRALRADDGEASDAFGISVAISGNYGVVGAIGGNGADTNSGAAYVFDLRNGRQLFKLFAPTGISGDGFGRSVSTSGPFALVGAPDQDNNGAGTVFDLRDGSLVSQLASPEATSNDDFGYSVSLCGSLALIGAPNRRAAYVFDIESETLIRKLTASDGVFQDEFGWSVSLEGGHALVGSPEHDSGRGAIYVFDPWVSGTETAKLTDPDAVDNDHLGYSVSHVGNLVLGGAYLADDVAGGAGVVLLFDLATGEVMRRLTPPDSDGGDRFGYRVAMFGNQAIVGADSDDDLGPGAGAAYYIRPLSGPFPLQTIAKVRDFAPETVEADFRNFIDPVIGPGGGSAFCSHLVGPGAGRGTTAKGLWYHPPGSVELVARGGSDIFGGDMANAISKPIMNHPSILLFQGTRKGGGIHRQNDGAVFSYDGNNVRTLLTEGQTDALFAGARLSRFIDVAQSHTGGAADVATLFQYQRQPGRVTGSSDTGMLLAESDGTILNVFHEGFPVASLGGGINWGQFFPRVAMSGERTLFAASLTGIGVTPQTNTALFRYRVGDGTETMIARKGDELAITTGFHYRTFLGETSGTLDNYFHRVIVDGPMATPANNEMLVVNGFGAGKKGTAVDPSQPQVKIRRFLKYWTSSISKFYFLAKLAGPGVNARNDCVLVLFDSSNLTARILLREGDPICGSDGVLVHTIQRVDVDPYNGNFVVLASLTGSPASNQALFLGRTFAGDNADQFAIRKPVLKLRKGGLYQAPSGESTRIRSLALTNTCDRFGAGGKGGPQVINFNMEIVACVLFTDSAKELVSGEP